MATLQRFNQIKLFLEALEKASIKLNVDVKIVIMLKTWVGLCNYHWFLSWPLSHLFLVLKILDISSQTDFVKLPDILDNVLQLLQYQEI